jgi:hypothetical protein
MYFDTAENESSILNQVPCKPLCLPSYTKWQNETQGTMNKAGQVLLQHNTACIRSLHRSTALPMPYIYIWDRLSHKLLTYFLLAASISTLKIAKPNVEDTESAKVYNSVVLP